MGMCTEKVKMKSKFILWAVLIVSVLLNLFLAGVAAKAEREKTEIIDTLIVRDTVRIVEPIHIKETIVRYDTVYLCSIDTIAKIDSIEVVVPITQKVYEDSLYKAWVSGYNQRLDSLHLYHKEVCYPMIVEKKVKPKVVVSAGVYGGFGVKGADYGLGISVGVPIWSW